MPGRSLSGSADSARSPADYAQIWVHDGSEVRPVPSSLGRREADLPGTDKVGSLTSAMGGAVGDDPALGDVPTLDFAAAKAGVHRSIGSQSVRWRNQVYPTFYPDRVARKLWLTGDALDLAYLAATLAVGDTQVIKDGDRFCMTSVEADTVADGQVREVARELVVRINGIGRLQNASFKPVEFADVYEDEAGVIVVGATAMLRAESRMTAEAVVVDADGNVVPQPPPPGPGRLAIAAANRDVAEVLQILGQPQPPNFAELYKIDEIIKSAGRLTAVMQSAGVSDKERRLFKQTADHQDASGADSRHARNKQQPPKSPMQIDQARAMIRKLVTAWLESL